MRTAPQKLRNRFNANQANVIQSSPRTRVNRYIGRLIEARQTESDTADLNVLTLMYKSSEREQRVRGFRHSHVRSDRASDWKLWCQVLFLCPLIWSLDPSKQYHQIPDEYFTSAVVLSLILAALFGLVYLLIIPQYVHLIDFHSPVSNWYVITQIPDFSDNSHLAFSPFFPFFSGEQWF